MTSELRNPNGNELTADQRRHRMNLRNAYLVESDETLDRAIMEALTSGDTFRAACLQELREME